MRYTWDINKILQEKSEIQRLLKIAKDNNYNTEDLQSYIDNLNDAIDEYYHLEAKENDDNVYIDKSNYLLKSNYIDYNKIPIEIRNDLYNSFKLLNNLDDRYNEIEFPKFRVSCDDLVCLARDFVNWLPTKDKIWKNAFYKFTNPKNHLLHFMKYDGIDGCFGITHPITYPENKSYMLVKRQYTIEDFVTLIHELSHGVVKTFGENQNHFVTELEGWYSEFLARNFLKEKKIVLNKYITQLDYDNFNTVYDFYLSYIVYHCCNKLKRQKKGINIDVIKRRVSKELKYFTLNEDLFKYYISVNPLYFSAYIYSYILSCDLEELYKIDPEFSFYDFNKFFTSYEEINHKTLRAFDFTFMENNYKSLQKKIDVINSL